MIDDIKTSLTELGLSGKEIDVYMAMLELGPTSIQEIGKKSGVNRTTCYVMIEALSRHGLVTTFEKGKKTLFAAETPQRLLSIITRELSKVDAKKARLELALPRLLAIYNNASDKPKVRFFEGEAAIGEIRREIAGTPGELWEFFAVDEPMLELAAVREDERIQLTSRMRGRALMAIKPGLQPRYFDTSVVDVRVVPYQSFPFSGNLAITDKRVYAMSLKSIGIGLVIESVEIAELMKALFQLAWTGARPWEPPPGWGKQRG